MATTRLPRVGDDCAVALQSMGVVLTGATAWAWMPVPDGTYIARYAAIVLMAVWWVVLWAVGALQANWRRNAMLYAVMGVAVVAVLLSSLLSADPAAALTWGAFSQVSAPVWLAWIITLGAAASLDFGRRTRDAVATVVAAGGLVAVLGFAGIGMRLGAYPWVNSNYSGPVLLLLAPLALGIAATVRGRTYRIVWRVAALLIWLAAVRSGSMAALIGGLCEATAVWMLRPELVGLRVSMRRRLAGVAALGLAAVVVLGGVYLVKGMTPSSLIKTQITRKSVLVRIDMWQAGAQVVAQHPVFGVGPDGYTAAAQPYYPRSMFLAAPSDNPQNVMPADPHGLPLLVLVSFGTLGGLVALAFGFSWLRSARPSLVSGSAVDFKWAVIIGVGGWFVAVLFLPVALVSGSLPALMAGLALVRPSGDAGRPTATPLKLGAGVAIAAVGAYLAVSGVLGWATFTRVQEAPDPSTYTTLVRRARQYQPSFRLYEWRELWVQAAAPSQDGLGAFQAAVDDSPRITSYAPYLVDLVQTSLNDAEATGRTDVAWELRMAEQALNAAPEYPDATLALARADLAAGQVDEARALLEENPDLEGAYPMYDALAEAVGGGR